MRAPALTYHVDVPANAALEVEELYRLTTDDYHRIIEAEIFAERAPIELLDGLLARKGVRSAAHDSTIAWLNQELVLAIDRERYQVRPQSAITLEPHSEPEPDLAIIARDVPRPYHPATAALVVEVSKSSLRRDLGRKAALYAAAGAPDYWVIDVGAPRAIAHRRPGEHGYAEVGEIRAGGELTAEALDVRIAFDDLVRGAGL